MTEFIEYMGERGRFEILEDLTKADCIVSDLDGTDFHSFGKVLIKEHVFSLDGLKPEFLWWNLSSLLTAKKKHGETWRWERWHEYRERYLGTVEDRARRTEGVLDDDTMAHLLFPGTRDLYREAPQTHRVYLTGNIAEVADAAMNHMGFDDFRANVYDKYEVMNRFILDHPQFQHYFIKGNSPEDYGMVEAALHHQDEGRIQTVTSAYMTPSYTKMNGKFEMNVGENTWEPLVREIKHHMTLRQSFEQ